MNVGPWMDMERPELFKAITESILHSEEGTWKRYV